METYKPQISIFQSTSAKMIMVGLLTLFLLIPLEYVKILISERTYRKKEVVNEVTQRWGKEIKFYGPILAIPHKSYTQTMVVDENNKKSTIQKNTSVNYCYFFPEILNNETKIYKNTSLKRGIYNNVVFNANMKFDGYFKKPEYEKLGINPDDMIWEKSVIIIQTTNLKGIKSGLDITLNTDSYNFNSNPNIKDSIYRTLETNTFDYKKVANANKINFSFKMKYNGSKGIKFIPIAKTTTVVMNSDWNSPSFEGAFAANEKTKSITKNGFSAGWKIIDINRPFSQEYDLKIPNLNEYLFGVKLIETVDQYQQNERVAKYGFLVIGLTFLIFFLIQNLSKTNIHIFQYTMIGLALVMFYTLLIGITEHSSFTLAYIIAGISVIMLISFYAFSILNNRKFSLLIGLSLTSLYSFIYVIIQLENYALLVGSIGLFAILSIVMYFSRKIDWNR